ncbi:DUF2336 domain-containing protein [Chthonobacter rhizosphaerae]|uniref:DUF2336 domain-containing protein n=1 Tax=Chthonobacter rhizosphaerae TaxID=2735553 RepID=UPI0015EF1F8C|nr:DUF2336 domain-containing protein [Chthonobacter rhizosphaerae]
MVSARFPNGVFQLAQASEANRGRALLKASTELFVSEPTHVLAEIHMYEELALQLLRITPLDDRRLVAHMLSRHKDAPAAVLRALMADDISVAAVIIEKAETVPEVDLIALVATGSPDHLRSLARRVRPSPALVEALVRNLPEADLPILLDNATARIPAHVMPMVIAAAQGRPEIARALGGRIEDLDDAALTDLFLDLDTRGRRRVVQGLEILALRAFASKTAIPRPPAPSAELVQALSRAALLRDLDVLAGLLADLLSVEETLARRLLLDEGGEPLAIALKAVGLDPATNTRLLLFTGGPDQRDYFQMKRLMDLNESISLRSAAILVSRWRQDRPPLPQRRPRHVPLSEEGSPLRAAAPAARRVPTAAPSTPATRDRA